MHAVIVEPEKRHYLAGVTSGRIVEIEVVDPVSRDVAAFVDLHIVRLAITLRCRMTVVEMGQEGKVGGPEITAVEVFRVPVEIVLEADYNRFAISRH